MSEEQSQVNDVLLQLHQLNVERSLHHQEQRSTVANLLLVVAGSLIVLVTFDQKFDNSDQVPGLLVVFIGVFGAFWSAKQHERIAFYDERAKHYLKVLGSRLSGVELIEIQTKADEEAEAKYGRWLNRLRVWYLWVFLYICMAGLGLAVTVTAIRAPRPPAEAGGGNPVRTEAPTGVRPGQPSK